MPLDAYVARETQWGAVPLRGLSGALIAYVAANPTALTDVHGTTAFSREFIMPYGDQALFDIPLPSQYYDGPDRFQMPIWWWLASPADKGGLIVQEVDKLIKLNTGQCFQEHYWEAWTVPGRGQGLLGTGQDTVRRIISSPLFAYDDTFSTGPGVIQAQWTTTARFYEGQTLDSRFPYGGAQGAGGLPSTTQDPGLPIFGIPFTSRFVAWWAQ